VSNNGIVSLNIYAQLQNDSYIKRPIHASNLAAMICRRSSSIAGCWRCRSSQPYKRNQ